MHNGQAAVIIYCGSTRIWLKNWDKSTKVGIAEAIILGAAAGFVGFLPMFAAIRLSRKSISTKAGSAVAFGLLGTLVSLAIVVVALILCSKVAHDALLPFAIAELVVLIAATSAYVLYKNVFAKRKER